MFVNKRQQLVKPKQAGLTGPGGPRRFMPDRLSSRAPKPTSSSLINTSPVAKTAQNKTLDWDDVSLSSDDSKSFQRFLKASVDDDKTTQSAPVLAKAKSDLATVDYGRPKTSRGATGMSSSKLGGPGGNAPSSSALDRLAQIEARFKGRQQIRPLNKVSLSASDFDPNVSSDLEIKKDIGKPDIKLREKLKKSHSAKLNPARSEHIFLPMDGASSSEESVGDHKKFIKGNVASAFSDEESSEASVKLGRGQIKSPGAGANAEIVKVHASTDLDESEASLRRYMKNLDNEDSEKPVTSKKVTFATELVRSSDYEQSLDDFLPMSENISSLDEILPSKIHNIMTLDDLEPTDDKKSDAGDIRSTASFEFEGLHTVDELLPAGSDLRSSSEYAISMEEDIHVEESQDASSLSDKPDRILQLRSVDDLELDLKPKKDPRTEPRGVFAAREVESQSDGIETESETYSEDFHSDDDTLKDTESISQDATSVSTSSAVGSVRDSTPEPRDVKEKDVHSHPSFSYSSDTSTPSTETPKPPRKLRKKKLGNMETQTDTTPGAWLPGSVYTDPGAFKPTRLVDNEALDIMTSYNPATLAIQDLLHQQVTLTKEFVARSRRLHDLAVSSIPCDYVYGEIDHASLDRLKRIMEETQDHAISTT